MALAPSACCAPLRPACSISACVTSPSEHKSPTSNCQMPSVRPSYSLTIPATPAPSRTFLATRPASSDPSIEPCVSSSVSARTVGQAFSLLAQLERPVTNFAEQSQSSPFAFQISDVHGTSTEGEWPSFVFVHRTATGEGAAIFRS